MKEAILVSQITGRPPEALADKLKDHPLNVESYITKKERVQNITQTIDAPAYDLHNKMPYPAVLGKLKWMVEANLVS